MTSLKKLLSVVVLATPPALLVGCQATEDPGRAPNEPGKTQFPQPEDLKAGKLEPVFGQADQYLIGVAVARDGRIFTCYPRWGDPVTFTVGEVKNGQAVAYPDKDANANDNNPDHLFSVQSVVVDPADRLWALDTGSVDMKPIRDQQTPKLVGFDLATNKPFKTIRFPADVVLPTTYLNDVRFDLARGPEGTAYITDSSAQGTNALIVVDLASGKSIRRLANHDSVTGDKSFQAAIEGKPLAEDQPDQPPKPILIGADGIALEAGGARLFYCPLSSRKLYSVDAAALADPSKTDADVARTIKEEDRPFASDGLAADAAGRIYLTDYEHNAILVRTKAGEYRTVAYDQRLWWPDTLALGADGHLYVTATQLHRQAKFNDGKDRRERPFQLFRVKLDAQPITQPAPSAGR